jgi:hypothetical protein
MRQSRKAHDRMFDRAAVSRSGPIVAAYLGVDASRVTRLQRDADNDARTSFKALWQLSGESRFEIPRTQPQVLQRSGMSTFGVASRRPLKTRASGVSRGLHSQPCRLHGSAIRLRDCLPKLALPFHKRTRPGCVHLRTDKTETNQHEKQRDARR